MDEPPKGSTFVSEEDYFPIFDKNSKDLQVLESLIVTHITEFYNYMKAMRDSLRRLDQMKPREGAESSPKTPDAETAARWKAVVSDVIYMLFLGYESGRRAIEYLIEYQPTAAENKMVILITELECYSYLREHFKDDQLRCVRLRKREPKYKQDVCELCHMVFDKKDVDDWSLAVLTVEGLVRVYKDTFKEEPCRVRKGSQPKRR